MNDSPPDPAPGEVYAFPFTLTRTPGGVFRVVTPDPDGAAALLDTPDELARSLTARDVPFADPGEGAAFWAALDGSAADGRPVRHAFRIVGRRTGRTLWLHLSTGPPRRDPGGAVEWAGVLVETTGLREAERQLRAAGQALSTHLDNTPLAVVEWDAAFRVTRWSGQAERVFGWAAPEVLGKRPWDWRFVHEDDAGPVGALLDAMTAGRNPRNVNVNRNYTRAGAVIWCEWHNSALYDDAGRRVSTLSLVLDVTDRRAAAESARRSEARLKAALDAADMLVWEWDFPDRRATFSGDPAAFFGGPPGADYAQGDVARTLADPADVPVIEAAVGAAVATAEPFRFEFRGRWPTPAGETRWFATRGQVIPGPGGAPDRIVAVSADITGRKRAEQDRDELNRKLVEAQKLESLGMLAGGLAHDFNNILTVILGNAGLARRDAPPGGPVATYLGQIEDASHRAADLCRQMLAFAGRAQIAFGPVDVNATARGTAALLEASVAARAALTFDLDPAAPPAVADQTQVRQVLTNLVLNAAEAIGDRGGAVRVETRAATLAAPPDGFHLPPAPGEYTVIRVADDGPGMPAEVRARVFDPFFTTKFAGRGLGLAAVLGIVRGHKGGLRVESEPGRGTVFEVYLPASAAPAPPPPPPPPPPAPAPVGGLALVVDDEIFVRELIASTLEELGLTPVLAGDGPSALARYAEHAGRVRVAVLDVVMPGMTGEQVLERLRADDPALPAVLVSGYSERQLSRVLSSGPHTAFVQKPFRPEELMAVVRRVMGVAAE